MFAFLLEEGFGVTMPEPGVSASTRGNLPMRRVEVIKREAKRNLFS